MAELNKDGLVPGQEVDFSTLMKITREHSKAVKDAQPESKPDKKPTASRSKKPSVPDVPEAKEQKEA